MTKEGLQAKEGSLEIPITKTIQEFLDYKERGVDQPPLQRDSLAAYNSDLKQFSNFCQEKGIVNLSQLRPSDIQDFPQSLAAKNYAESSVARKTAVIREYLKHCGIVHGLPQEFADSLPEIKVEEGERQYLTLEEAEKLMQQSIKRMETTKEPKKEIAALRDAVLIHLALKTGALVSEIVELKGKNVSKTNGSFLVEFRRGKKLRKRQLDIQTSSLLLEFLSRTQLEPDEYLFSAQRNNLEHLSRQGFWFILKSYDKEISPRTLRNTYAKHFFEGETPEELAIQLGLVNSHAASRFLKGVGR